MLKPPTLNDVFERSSFYTVLIEFDDTVYDDLSVWGQA